MYSYCMHCVRQQLYMLIGRACMCEECMCLVAGHISITLPYIEHEQLACNCIMLDLAL